MADSNPKFLGSRVDHADLTTEWFWEMDQDLRFTYFSNNVDRLYGFPIETHIGKTRDELIGIDASTPEWQAPLKDLEERKPFENFCF